MGLEDKPNKHNVNLGDLLVSDFDNIIALLTIKRIDEDGVFAEGIRVDYKLYKNSIILKPDGNYLVGEKVMIGQKP